MILNLPVEEQYQESIQTVKCSAPLCKNMLEARLDVFFSLPGMMRCTTFSTLEG